MREAPRHTVSRVPMTEARNALGQLAQRVHLGGEYFILEKDGVPVAGLMGADELEDYLELRDPEVKARIRQARLDIEAGLVRPARSLLEELKSQSRSSRARHE